MRAAIVTVALVFGVLVFIKGNTVANTEATKSSTQNAMSIYDLHAGHPNMKNLPVDEAPLP